MTEWPFTGLGRKFFDGQLPSLVRNLGLIAAELKRYNDVQEALEQDSPYNFSKKKKDD